jgi:hypothetical protein
LPPWSLERRPAGSSEHRGDTAKLSPLPMRPALEVADVFRHHGAAYRAADHAATLSNRRRRVMAAIEACRTPALGGHVESMLGIDC